MLITCSGCNSEIRVPRAAAGKRVKCPKCATPNRVSANNPDTDPPPTVVPKGSAAAPSPRPGPPPLPPSRGNSRDDDDVADLDDDDRRSDNMRTRADDGYDIGDDEGPRQKRRRREESDDDDSGVRRRKKRKRNSVNGMAMASMFVGIGSLNLLIVGPCIGSIFIPKYSIFVVPLIAFIGAVVAIVLGKNGMAPGSKGFAYAGLVCGYLVLFLFLVAILVMGIHLVMPFPGGKRLWDPQAR